MPRQALVVAVDVSHHSTHRGNNRQEIFLSDADRCRYQRLLSLHPRGCRANLLDWCWMTNHDHMIAVPRCKDSLSSLTRAETGLYYRANWAPSRVSRVSNWAPSRVSVTSPISSPISPVRWLSPISSPISTDLRHRSPVTDLPISQSPISHRSRSPVPDLHHL